MENAILNNYITKCKGIDPIDGQIKVWHGPIIQATSWKDAENIIKNFGYLEIVGKLVCIVDEFTNEKIDYDNLN